MFPAFVGIVGGLLADSFRLLAGTADGRWLFKERLVQLLYMHEILPNVPICNSRLISSIGLPKLLEAAKYTKKKKKSRRKVSFSVALARLIRQHPIQRCLFFCLSKHVYNMTKIHIHKSSSSAYFNYILWKIESLRGFERRAIY